MYRRRRYSKSSIIPAGNVVYLLAQDEKESVSQLLSFVVAVDAQTGEEVWPNRFYIPESNSGAGLVQGIVYDGGLNLIYVSFYQDVYAVNAATGTQVWHYEGVCQRPRFSSPHKLCRNGATYRVGRRGFARPN